MQINKDEFMRYDEVKKSGVTNMVLINNVCDLTDLERDKVLYIMKHYDELYDVFIRGVKNEN
jgi:hypothetical protein